MEIIKLTEEDFNYIKKILDIWKEQFDSIMALPFEEQRKNLIEITENYLKEKWPEVKYKILDYKGNLDIPKDNIAFYIGEDKPELYIYITQSGPLLFDSYRYDAYDKGPFERPKWD